MTYHHLGAEHNVAKPVWLQEEIKDLLTEAIADSIDLDWAPSWGAENILYVLERNGLAIIRRAV